jgi:agmatine deiminase
MNIFTILLQILLITTPDTTLKTPTLPKGLPAYKTKGELSKDTNVELMTYKMSHPEIFGITVPPPVGYKLYAEFSNISGIYLVYDNYFASFYLDLIRESAEVLPVYILHHNIESSLNQTLSSSIDSTTMLNVNYINMSETEYYINQAPYYDVSIDSFWLVDSGPFFLKNSNNEVIISDPLYYPDRMNDDSIPTRLGEILQMSAYRPQIFIEGGNLISDGTGNCYATTMIVQENPDKTQTEINTILSENFGCTTLVWLDPLQGEDTGHIDMFFILTSATTAIVGEYTVAQDSGNKTLLDANVQILETAGLTVKRIPMLPPITDSYGRIWRTYTNGLRINDRYLVPVYDNDTTFEATALAIIQSDLPGVEIVPLAADEIITWGGAIHCVTRTQPDGTPVNIPANPAYLCDGKPLCEDCSHDCSVDELGCTTDGSRFLCGNFDEDVCRERVIIPCPDDKLCSGGYCGTPCTDECFPNEKGCTGDATRWECAEIGDGDACLEKVSFECSNTRTCIVGNCIIDGNGCGDLDYDGECQGDVSVWCDEDYDEIYMDNCNTIGLTCGYNSTEGYYDCVDRTPCTDECYPGDGMCGVAPQDIEYCGEVFDGDNCYEWIASTCDGTDVCDNGSCVGDTTCPSTCILGEIGCSDEFISWECVESTAYAGCNEIVETTCGTEDTCSGGTCGSPSNSSESSCSCKTGTNNNKEFPGLFIFLSILGLFVFRRSQL